MIGVEARMAIPLPLYPIDQVNPNSAFGDLQIYSRSNGGGGGPPNTQTFANTGCIFPTGTLAANESTDMAYGTVQAAGTFSTTLGPTAGAGTTRCFATGTALWGTFAATNWALAVAVIMTTIATSGSGNIRLRVYRGTLQSGVGATEITSSTLVLSNFNLHTATQQDTTGSWSPGLVTLSGEYLFCALAFEAQAGAVISAGAECKLVQDATHTVVTTPVFTPVSTLYVVASGISNLANAGTDGSLDQVYANGQWTQTFPFNGGNNMFGATCCFDPTSVPSDQTNLTGGIFWCFGNEDDESGANSTLYNPRTNTFFGLGGPGLTPSGCMGYGCGVALNGVSYCIGGGQQDTPVAVATVFSWNNSQAISTGVYVTSYNPIPTAACNGFGCAVGNLIYHGGGDAVGSSVCLNTFYSWNPITDTRTALANLPAVLAGAACIALDSNHILVVGGFNVSQKVNFNTNGVNSVYLYTISTNTWTTMGNYPVGASFASGCMWNDAAFVLSGWPVTGSQNFTVPANNVVYQYSGISTDMWTLHSTLFSGGGSGVVGFIAAAVPPSNPITVLPTDTVFFGMT
jgi:hypothetical protein